MEYLSQAFSRLKVAISSNRNLEYVGTYHYEPRTIPANENTIEAHQRVLMHAMKRYLYPYEIEYITQKLRRSTVDPESIYKDFFAGDVDHFDIPFDDNVNHGIECMAEAFAPPQPCLPVHLCDVEHHYPYKWNVNAEPPFSTDKYFLDNRKAYSDFWNPDTQMWDKYIDPIDMSRRLGTEPVTALLQTITPPKFGFMKETVFSWTRRWLHVVKDNFQNSAGLSSPAYVRDRFVFPMLLHTKTAIVKKDDPNKMRTIWGCSKPWIIADTMLWWEYIAWLKLNPGVSPMLWGYETFTGGWLRLNRDLFDRMIKTSFLTVDWSRFDKRAYFPLIERIMHKVKNYIDFHSGYCPTKDYPTYDDWNPHKALRLDRLYSWTLLNLFQAPIVLPDGKMYKRKFAGIPSGLFITQLLDSWYNYVMIATVLNAMGFDPKHCVIKVQGDDSITRLAVLVPPLAHEDFLLRLSEIALHYFNAVVSVEKSEIRNELNGCEVLSYRHQHGLPYRDEIAMLGQFYHTKAKNPTPQITMAQAVGFAYASCGNHKRVLLVLENIFNFYRDQGYTASPAGLTLVFGDSPDRAALPHMVDHFPTVHEIKQYHTCAVYSNPEQERKTWPTNHFLFPPCDRHKL